MNVRPCGVKQHNRREHGINLSLLLVPRCK
jgi:hypothetical protein